MTHAVLDAVLHRRAARLLDRLRSFLPRSGRVLDVGAGTGHNADALRRGTMLAVTEADVARLRTIARDLVLFDGVRLPFHDRAFACSLLLYVLHYADDPARLLAEARRVTAGPIIVLQAIHVNAIGRRVLPAWELASGRLAFGLARRVGLVPADCVCPLDARRQFSRAELVDVATSAGLRPLDGDARSARVLGVGSDLHVFS